jgi:DNA polymerase-3 subunit epsilon
MNFVAIDFETATHHHICAVGIVTVENGLITDEYVALIQPPGNWYNWYNTQVHGITSRDTKNAPLFDAIFPEIKNRLSGKLVVAHNEAFDRNVLKKTMLDYGLDYSELNIADRWECTVKIYRAKGYHPANLEACCKIQKIALNHHEALSDAQACALLYLKR